jgi:drug/metabolite transporter (DMT)-like permease
MFGVLLGAVLLNETLELPFIIGSLMVTGGIVLVSGESILRSRKAAPAATQPCQSEAP